MHLAMASASRARSRSDPRRQAPASREQCIQLDCAPLQQRPNELLPIALRGTRLPMKDACSQKTFGCWTFDYSDVEPDVWSQARPLLEANITRLYEQGQIRFGSW